MPPSSLPSQTPTPTTSLTTSRSPSPNPSLPPGLGNLGNTCYLNSVVQVLYHIPKFRQSILEWNTHPAPLNEHRFSHDLTHALRTVFLQLDAAAHAPHHHHHHHHPHHHHLHHHHPNAPDPPDANTTTQQQPPQSPSSCNPQQHQQQQQQKQKPDLRSLPNPPSTSPPTSTTSSHPSHHPPQQQSHPVSRPHNYLRLPSHPSLPPDEYDPEYPDDDDAFLADDDDDHLPDDAAREGIDFINPQHIMLLLRDPERCTEFDATGQQDAHEFLRFLLDKVDDCLQKDPDEHDHHLHHHHNTSPDTPDQYNPHHQNGHATDTDQSHPTDTHVSPSTSATDGSASGASASGSACDLNNNTTTTNNNNNHTATAHPEQPAPPPLTHVLPPIESKTIPHPSPTTNTNTTNPAHSPHPPARSPATKRRRCDACEQPDSTSGDTHASSQQPEQQRNQSAFCATAKRPRKRYRRQLVTGLFQGKAKTATRCDECECLTERCENFLDVSLPVEPGRNLYWALSSQGARESLRGDNKYSCENCQTYTEAQRWWQLAALPEVLTVHLKLFAFEGAYSGGGGKVPVAMACPVSMKFSDWCSTDCKEKDDMYKLTAVIVHEGTGASSGHYYSYIYKEDKHGWYVFDDNFVTAVAEKDVTDRLFTSMKSKRTAYVLFYTHWKK